MAVAAAAANAAAKATPKISRAFFASSDASQTSATPRVQGTSRVGYLLSRGTWVRRGSSWEEAHSEENTKRELLIDRPPKQFEHHFHPRAEGFVPAKERGNSSAADAALPTPPLSQPPHEPLRGGSPRGKQPARDLDRDPVRV